MPSRIATVASQPVVYLLLLALGPLAAAPDSKPLYIAGSSWVADAPTKVADQLGAFNDPGISPQIKVVNYNSGKEALSSLLAGDSDFAIVHHGRLDPSVILLSKPYRCENLAATVRKALSTNSTLP